MAQGEARYNSAGRSVVRFDNKPIPVNDYQLELQEAGLEVKKSAEKGPDAIPYINSRLTALGTAAKEGAKDRLIFHKWFLSLKPGSDGVVMPERGGGLVEFCRSYGEEADFAILSLKLSDGSTVKYFDPEEVLEYLKGKVGEPRQAHVTIEKKKDQDGKIDTNHPGDNKIAYWQLDASVMTGEEAEEETETKPASKLKKAGGKK